MRLGDWANGVLGKTPVEAARLNYRDTLLDAALASLARDPSLLFSGTVTRDGNGVPTSASVLWPDGSAGVYSGTASTAFPTAVDAYTVTRVLSTGTVTYTQPAVTRDASGNITARPNIVVS